MGVGISRREGSISKREQLELVPDTLSLYRTWTQTV